MRVSTAFNTMLGPPGGTGQGVIFEPGGAVVRLGIRARRPACACGDRRGAIHDRPVPRWRHLDLGGMRVYV